MSIRDCKIYKALIYPVLQCIGYYKMKAKFRKWARICILTREDTQKKSKIKELISNLPIGFLPSKITKDSIVISLTSYGKRVEDTLPYVLYTLVTQTIRVGKIVVYLDNDNWSDEKLPSLLQHFKRVGVDFRYCDDLRSYKKIIPALRDFPDNPIITVDDDLYYNDHMVEWLLDAHKNLPKKSVVGLWACIVAARDGKYLPYNTWKDCQYKTLESEFALYTGYGTLYPPHIFDKEVMNSEIFLALCPTADDIWMWAMEKRLNIPVYVTENAALGLHTDVNRKNMLFPEENKESLYYVNELMGNKNDEQLNNLVNYYNLYPSK